MCNDGDIRLQDGSNPREGRVEICHGQAWGTVCDNLWSDIDAGVACTQLGYTPVGQYSANKQTLSKTMQANYGKHY